MAENVALPQELIASVNAGDVVFFLGAGCSMESPAELPSARDLAGMLIAAGYGSEGDSLEQVVSTAGEN